MKFIFSLLICYLYLLYLCFCSSLKRQIHLPNILKMHSFLENPEEIEANLMPPPPLLQKNNIENPKSNVKILKKINNKKQYINIGKDQIEDLKSSLQILVFNTFNINQYLLYNLCLVKIETFEKSNKPQRITTSSNQTCEINSRYCKISDILVVFKFI